MFEYIVKAATVWFIAFFPLTGLISAIPAGVALGLDNVSVVVWSVLGHFTPAVLIDGFYTRITRIRRINDWLQGLVSERVRERVDRWGIWFVLLATPWTTVWAMAVTVKTLGMSRERFLVCALISIAVYAVAILVLVQFGIATFESGVTFL